MKIYLGCKLLVGFEGMTMVDTMEKIITKPHRSKHFTVVLNGVKKFKHHCLPKPSFTIIYFMDLMD